MTDERADAPAAPGPADPPAIEDAEERSLSRRLRDRRVIVEERIGETRRKLEDARPRNTAIDTAFRALERDVATGGGVLSAAVAFRVFLFLVPFALVLVVAFGYAADASGQSSRELARSVGITGLIARSFTSAAALSGVQRLTTLLVGLFALAWAARGAIKVLRIVHGLIWRVPIPKLRSTPRAVGAFVGLACALVVMGAGVAWLRDQSLILGVIGLVLSMVVPGAVWLLASWWLPRADGPWWALGPGAVLFGVGVTALHAFTVIWIVYEVDAKSDTYGAIATSLALLFWAYLLGRIVTAAASVNAAFWYRSEERRGHAVPAAMDIEAQLESGTIGSGGTEGATAPDVNTSDG